jgi:hypothetical protein
MARARPVYRLRFAVARDGKAAPVMGFFAIDAALRGLALGRIALGLLAVLLPGNRRDMVRVDDAQDVLDDLPVGEFREEPHGWDMGMRQWRLKRRAKEMVLNDIVSH